MLHVHPLNMRHITVFYPSILRVLNPLQKMAAEFDICRILPRELVHEIFLYLDLDHWIACQRVCKSWQRFLTSDASLWRSSIESRELDPHNLQVLVERFERCLNYALEASNENVIIKHISIELIDTSGLVLDLLSRDMANAHLKGIDFLSIRDTSSDELAFLEEGIAPFIRNIFRLVPISYFELTDWSQRMLALDDFLESQANSLEKLVILFCHSVVFQNKINPQTQQPVVYPLLQTLELNLQHFDVNVINAISACINITELTLATGRGDININHLLNNVPSTLRSLNLIGLDLNVDPRYGVCFWPPKLTSLNLSRSLLVSSFLISGSLNGLKNLRFYEDRNDIVRMFNDFKCGPNLKSLEFAEIPERQFPDAILLPNLEKLSFVTFSEVLGHEFERNYLSQCLKLEKLKELHFYGMNCKGEELVETLVELANMNLREVYISRNRMNIPDIEKITNLGVTVYEGSTVHEGFKSEMLNVDSS